MSDHYIDRREENAIRHHTSNYKVHTFYIRSVEEYVTMEPFIGIFPNVKLILGRGLRNGLFKIMVARYKRRLYKRNWDREKARKRKLYKL